MLLRQQRHEFLVPKLNLFRLGERTYVSNYRRFFLHDRIDLTNQFDDFRGIAPDLGVVSMAPKMDQPSGLISSLSSVAKITVFLQFTIVVT
jgi:hypothetical protein